MEKEGERKRILEVLNLYFNCTLTVCIFLLNTVFKSVHLKTFGSTPLAIHAECSHQSVMAGITWGTNYQPESAACKTRTVCWGSTNVTHFMASLGCANCWDNNCLGTLNV